MFYLPTYEECEKIVKCNEHFEKKEGFIGNYLFTIYNYRLASYSDFNDPFNKSEENFPNLKAFELRGLTFIHDGENTYRWLALHKFFNVNQTIEYMYDDVKDKEIVQVQEKLDGSMITFVKLPDGHIYPKTKISFFNDQAKLSREIAESNPDYLNFIVEMLDRNIVPVFELVSPFNRIVLKYKESALKLIQLRDNNTGEYLDMYQDGDPYNIKFYDIDHTPKVTVTLDELLKIAKVRKDHEGEVVTFADGQKAKIKTEWYLITHRLLFEDLSKENWIIKAVLEEVLDDALGQLDKDDPIREHVEKQSEVFSSYVVKQFDIIKKKFLEYDGNRKEYAIKNKDYEYFPVLMQCVTNMPKGDIDIDEEIKNQFKQVLLKRTRKLEMARTWLQKHDLLVEKNYHLNEEE